MGGMRRNYNPDPDGWMTDVENLLAGCWIGVPILLVVLLAVSWLLSDCG